MSLTSCLEDNLDFPEPDLTRTTSSTALVSLLNTLSNNRDITCFDFVYPLKLRLSNDILIEVASRSALHDISKDQNSGVHVSELAFPVLITSNNQINSIDSEQEFFELLQSCELPTLRTILERTHKQCFDFVYPITLIDIDSTTKPIPSLDDYIQFYYNNQPSNYQPNFVFPFEITRFSRNESITIGNVFELFEQLNSCGSCPDLFFETSQRKALEYQFTATISGASTFDWYVDDVFIQEGTAERNILVKSFDPGDHEVCIKAKSEDCTQGEVYCEAFVVEDPCPQLFFETVKKGYGHYLFEANFEKMFELASYKWYINGTFKEEEGILQGNDSDHKFEYRFDPGSYEVCIKTTTDDCPEGTQYCEQVNVECIQDLNFDWDLETDGYTFTANFELRDEVTYIWSAYLRDELVTSLVREAGSTSSHDFIVLMEQGQSYTICLKQDGGCDERKVCEVFEF
ncbi:MAG: hypothetical protein RIC35_12290 [Marinoscillum sp.]